MAKCSFFAIIPPKKALLSAVTDSRVKIPSARMTRHPRSKAARLIRGPRVKRLAGSHSKHLTRVLNDLGQRYQVGNVAHDPHRFGDRKGFRLHSHGQCPVEAVFPEWEVPDQWQEIIPLNAEMSAQTPSIVEKREPLVRREWHTLSSSLLKKGTVPLRHSEFYDHHARSQRDCPLFQHAV